MRIIICDDNNITRTMYHELLKDIGAEEGLDINITSVSSGEELLVLLEREYRSISLIYLDIYLGGMDGFSVARRSRELGYRGDIIICSSDDSRALEAFQVDAVNYIVKGETDYERFKEVFLNSVKRSADQDNEEIVLVKGREQLHVKLDEVCYFEVFNRQIVTHYIEKDRLCSLETYGTLKSIEEKVKGRDFVRIHNSYLVNGKCIKYVFSDHIQLTDGERLPVSRGCKKNLMAYWTSSKS